MTARPDNAAVISGSKPDPQLFDCKECPRTFNVSFAVEGEVSIEVTADDEAEARQFAANMMDNVEFGLELDEVTDFRVLRVYKGPKMYLVTRDGQNMSVSHLQAGDVPRDPAEYERQIYTITPRAKAEAGQ